MNQSDLCSVSKVVSMHGRGTRPFWLLCSALCSLHRTLLYHLSFTPTRQEMPRDLKMTLSLPDPASGSTALKPLNGVARFGKQAAKLVVHRPYQCGGTACQSGLDLHLKIPSHQHG